MTSHRAERVGDVIREILARVVHEEMRDPRLGFVTFTGVKLSPDLKQAQVFLSVLGPAEARAQAVRLLNHAAPFLRRSLARSRALKHTPELQFEEDEAVERGSRVEAILKHLHDERGTE